MQVFLECKRLFSKSKILAFNNAKVISEVYTFNVVFGVRKEVYRVRKADFGLGKAFWSAKTVGQHC